MLLILFTRLNSLNINECVVIKLWLSLLLKTLFQNIFLAFLKVLICLDQIPNFLSVKCWNAFTGRFWCKLNAKPTLYLENGCKLLVGCIKKGVLLLFYELLFAQLNFRSCFSFLFLICIRLTCLWSLLFLFVCWELFTWNKRKMKKSGSQNHKYIFLIYVSKVKVLSRLRQDVVFQIPVKSTFL